MIIIKGAKINSSKKKEKKKSAPIDENVNSPLCGVVNSSVNQSASQNDLVYFEFH